MSEPTAEDWKRAGDLCLEREDYEGAMEAYFEALRLVPEHPAVRYNLALVHLERNAYMEAIALLRGVLASQPGNHEALSTLGWALLWNGEATAATKAFRRALMQQHNFTPAFVGLGWAHMAETPPALGRAADAFAKAIALDTDDPEAYHGLATACELREEPAQAVPLLEAALHQWPQDIRSLESLARVHESLGQWEIAASYLMRLAHHDEANADYVRRLACLFDAHGARDRAAVFWRKVRNLLPYDPTAAAMVGESLIFGDRPAEAVAALRIASDAAPDDAEAVANLGHACFYAGQMEEAIALYARAAELAPGVATHTYNLGNAYMEHGAATAAAAAYRHTLVLAPELLEARVGLGWAYCEAGDMESARDCFELALGRAPEDVGALDGMGTICSREGHAAAALSFIQRAVALDPEAGGLRLKLGMILEDLGRFAEARRVLAELVSGTYTEERATEALARLESRLGPGGVKEA